jgi:hypothetical protein
MNLRANVKMIEKCSKRYKDTINFVMFITFVLPYTIAGMLTGWFLWKLKGKLKIPLWTGLFGWPGALAIFGSLVYGMKDGYLEKWPTAFYVSIGHTGKSMQSFKVSKYRSEYLFISNICSVLAWGVGLAWIVLWCISRKSGILSKILGYSGVLPLSRLAYCAYLVHPMIMMMTTNQLDGPIHLHTALIVSLLRIYLSKV